MNPANFVHVTDCNGRPVDGLMNTNWSITATHATAATATKAGVAATHHVLTGIVVSSDLDGALCTVKQGTTIKIQFTIKAGAFTLPIPTHLVFGVNTAINIAINGTAACYANGVGYSVEV
jgi:hypothetical protein